MPTPSKQAQEAEAAARSGSAPDTSSRAAALDVADDGQRGDVDRQAAPLTPQTIVEPPPPRHEDHEFVTRRNDIVARFRENRAEIAAEEREDISDFARSGMPPEMEPEPEPEPEPAPVEAAEPEAPQRVKVKVRGVEQELTQDELIAAAQKSLAGDSYLDEGRAKLNEIDRIIADAKNRVSPPTGTVPATPRADQSGQPQATADPPVADASNTPDEIDQLIEAMQYGDPAEAKTRLQSTIRNEASQIVQQQLMEARLQDEGARSQKVLADFIQEHAELAADPYSEAVIQRGVYDIQVADLKAIGIEANTLQTAHGGPATPADIAMAHRWYRTKGLNLTSPKDMLETSVSKFLKWKGVEPNKPATTPAVTTKAPPRVEVTVDRTARREAIPQQPSRAAAPQRASVNQPAPLPRDRSDTVRQMMARRNCHEGTYSERRKRNERNIPMAGQLWAIPTEGGY